MPHSTCRLRCHRCCSTPSSPLEEVVVGQTRMPSRAVVCRTLDRHGKSHSRCSSLYCDHETPAKGHSRNCDFSVAPERPRNQGKLHAALPRSTALVSNHHVARHCTGHQHRGVQGGRTGHASVQSVLKRKWALGCAQRAWLGQLVRGQQPSSTSHLPNRSRPARKSSVPLLQPHELPKSGKRPLLKKPFASRDLALKSIQQNAGTKLDTSRHGEPARSVGLSQRDDAKV